MIAIINTSDLTEELMNSVYCYSLDASLVMIFCESAPENAIDSFMYEEVSAMLQTEAWKQPQDGEE